VRALRDDGINAPATCGLAEVVAGRVAAGDWAHEVTAPRRGRRFVRAA
jgi:hypothetical protein